LQHGEHRAQRRLGGPTKLIVVSGEGVTCLEPDRMDRLQVAVRAGVSDELVRSQLSSLGLLGGVVLRYARNRGWMREAALVRAHLTRADPSTQDAPTRDGRS
jgi:hypothetical protein